MSETVYAFLYNRMSNEMSFLNLPCLTPTRKPIANNLMAMQRSLTFWKDASLRVLGHHKGGFVALCSIKHPVLHRLHFAESKN